MVETTKTGSPYKVVARLEPMVESSIPIQKNGENLKRMFVEQAFHLYGSSLQNYLRSSNLTDVDVEEIHQETYVRLLKQEDIGRIRPKLKGYLFAIATNLLIDRVRRNKVRCVNDHMPLEDDILPADTPDPEELLSLNQSLKTVKRAIKELRPKYRQVFIMSRYMHMDHTEIAIKLGVSVRTVERRIKLALELLQRRLERFS